MSIYPRVQFEMSEGDLNAILKACEPVPYIIVGGVGPEDQHTRANRAWEALGKKMGFDYMTVMPVEGRGQCLFTAVPSETADQGKERLDREEEAKRMNKIKELEEQIRQAQAMLDELKDPGKIYRHG